MPKINVDAIEWKTWASPKGKFSSRYKDISIALGAKAKTPVGAGGHPFDLAMEALKPGEVSCPFHSHGAQWEMFYILGGRGTVRLASGPIDVGPGDVLMHEPGEAHQISNTGSEDLTYFIIADNPLLDSCEYPDSKKVVLSTDERFFRQTDAGYWDGEE